MAANYKYSISYLSGQNEIGRFSIYVGSTAPDLETVGDDYAALTTALQAIIDGTIYSYSASAGINAPGDPVGAGVNTNRVGLLIQDDSTRRKYTASLGTVKAALLDANIDGNGVYDLTATPWAAFKTAFEAVAKTNNNNDAKLIRVFKV